MRRHGCFDEQLASRISHSIVIICSGGIAEHIRRNNLPFLLSIGSIDFESTCGGSLKADVFLIDSRWIMCGQGPVRCHICRNTTVSRGIHIKIASRPHTEVLPSVVAHKLGIELTTRNKRILKQGVIGIGNSLVFCACDGIVVLHDTHCIEKLVLLGRNILLVDIISLRLQHTPSKHLVRCVQVR